MRPLRIIGEGATSRVWLVEGAGGSRVALKVGRGPEERGRLADEAERLLLVDSPELVEVVDAGTVPATLGPIEGGLPFVAMSFVDGVALDVHAERPAPARLELALAVARDVGKALADLHAAGSAHGDVKPANLLVRGGHESGRVCLVDLGLAAAADEVVPRGGTPRYLAPEVFSSATGDARARDLFALGLTLAELADPRVARSPQPVAAAAEAELAAPLAELVRALLSEAPAARPSAAWVYRRAALASGFEEQEPDRRARARRAVQRAYLAVRRRELLAAVRHASVENAVPGTPGQWLSRALETARSIAALRSGPVEPGSIALHPLDELGRARWLVALVGPAAASWSVAPELAEERLAERLLELAGHAEPEAFTLTELSGLPAAQPIGQDTVTLALAFGSGRIDAATLDAAERLVVAGSAPPALVLALGRALRLRGQLGRALLVLERLDGSQARLEAAEAARRAGVPALAQRLLDGAATSTDPAAEARRRATLARIALEQHGPAAAHGLLEGAPESAAIHETRAVVAITQGRFSAAADSAERARLLAADEEERARAAAVAAMAAQRAGNPEAALDAFRSAAEHAVRAGAVLEEATYLTGLASAASDLGAYGEALAASRRAILLFEYLRRPADAARAALARAAGYAAIGAGPEAREAALDAMERARGTGDPRCTAYAHLALADVAPEPAEAKAHAERAMQLLEASSDDDRLWAASRLVACGGALDRARFDALARDAALAVEARLDWWGARARIEVRAATPDLPELVVGELNALSSQRAPTSARGAALSAGAELAARSGDGDSARRLTLAAGEAARELLRRAPPELSSKVAALPWIGAVQSPREAAIAPEQLSDVETLVRALGRRDNLRQLLDQVLDALVLWTGVERGLLLLRAPGGRLVPRAARNLARRDLSGAQLELSRTLAERALAQREPVVAVDAAGELPEVHASVHALKLRSVLGVPLLARGEALGVVYLDDRVRRGAFGPRELSWVRMVAALAAVAIADARDQILLRRAARRAQRAEARLAEELARREAELDLAERELARAREARHTRFAYDEIVGKSEPIGAMLRVVDRVTLADVPVLIAGESGSGKELVARAIHNNGRRSRHAFVSENCGAIPEGLLESTLFGHVRGAFTGASRPRAGLFEIADQGTLFLDEIAEMSLGMQTKLLRVLENGEVRPIGSERARKVDVRVIAATHRDLEQRVKSGSFREDLYYRLNVISVRVPPLRERAADIPLLVRWFVEHHAKGRRVRVARAVLDALAAHAWPGNVRQLENEIRRALVLADDVVDLEHLTPDILDRSGSEAARPEGLNVRRRVDALEVELVTTALGRTDGNQTRAAELLGLSRFGLQKMMRRLKIGSVSDRRSPPELSDQE